MTKIALNISPFLSFVTICKTVLSLLCKIALYFLSFVDNFDVNFTEINLITVCLIF